MHRSLDNSGGNYVTYRLKAIGQKFIGGVSSRYDDRYDRILENVVSERELTRIVDELNDVLISHWPCNTCFIYGYLCLPCTLGLSLLAPGFCASQAEVHGQKFLRNVSLTAKFYDNNISFVLVKTTCDSYVEVRFPAHLAPRSQHNSNGDLESCLSSTSKTITSTEQDMAAEMSPLLNSISGGRRIKDN